MSKSSDQVTTVGTGYLSATVVNANFTYLNDNFDRFLHLDGEGDNAFTTDLDLNSNDLLNGGAASFNSLVLNGQTVTSLSAVPSWEGEWTTSTAYVVDDITREDGNVYICLVPHTSGTFATDLSNNYWELFASKGSAGVGSGDLLASNNLSDVASAATARSNLAVPGNAVSATISGAWTYSTDTSFADNVKLTFGAGVDGGVYSDGSDMVMYVNHGNTLRLKSSSGAHLARFYSGAGFEFGFNNVSVLNGDVGGIRVTGDIALVERSDHASTITAGRGYLWAKDDTPNVLMFTDDAGTDYQVATETSLDTRVGLNLYYESTAQTYSNGGLLTLTHGLSSIPHTITASLECISADANHSVGDIVPCNSVWISGSNYYGISPYADATNVYVQVGATGLRDYTTGGSIGTIFDPSKWEMTVRAWA